MTTVLYEKNHILRRNGRDIGKNHEKMPKNLLHEKYAHEEIKSPEYILHQYVSFNGLN